MLIEEETMKFLIGNRYSRDRIQRALGGEIQSYLPQYGGKIVAGCFTRKMNPDAPIEVQVGDAPKVVTKAELFSKQRDSRIPVFLKGRRVGDTDKVWEYQGLYEFLELIDDQKVIDQAEGKSGRYREVAYILRLRRVSD
jgi:hypothetical protein